MLLLIAPAAILMLLFQVVPIVIGANASFRDWALNDPKKTWVGLEHYRQVLTDPAFLQVVLPRPGAGAPAQSRSAGKSWCRRCSSCR
jgi:multiple sugar transport system permease protein